ncbi:hypothetical protein F5Y17DRAFT_370427 [Xylariaceae sp. FL0594]|nr:hypothetical protein F5Y17DRAFT_370427 [Xylariaceae sp. FL0594]
MPTFRDIICAAAPTHRKLLLVLSKTEHAATELACQRQLFEALEEQLVKAQSHSTALDKKRIEKLDRYTRYRDASLTRVAYRARGHTAEYEAKLRKCYAEYLDLLAEADAAKDEWESLVLLRSEAKLVMNDMEGQAKRRENAERELEALYETIFVGAPAHVLLEEERQLRAGINQITEERKLMRAKLKVVRAALKTLETAKSHADVAVAHVDSAVRNNKTANQKHTRWHLLRDRVLLNAVETPMRLASSAWENAKDALPAGEILGPSATQIKERFKTWNGYSDRATVSERSAEILTEIWDEVSRYHTILETQLLRLRSSKERLTQGVAEKLVALETARASLRSARKLIFDQVVNDGLISESINSPGEGEGGELDALTGRGEAARERRQV